MPLRLHPCADLLRIVLQPLHVGATEVQIDHHLPEAGAGEGGDVLHRGPQVGIVEQDPPGVAHHVELAEVSFAEVAEAAVDRRPRDLALAADGPAGRVADGDEGLPHSP